MSAHKGNYICLERILLPDSSYLYFVAILVLGENPKKLKTADKKHPDVRITTFDRLKDLLLGKLSVNDLPVDDVSIQNLLQHKRKRAKKKPVHPQQPAQQQPPKGVQDNLPHSDTSPVETVDTAFTEGTSGEHTTRTDEQIAKSISSGMASTEQSKPEHGFLTPGTNGAVDDREFLSGKLFTFDGEFPQTGNDLNRMIESFGGRCRKNLTANTGECSAVIYSVYP